MSGRPQLRGRLQTRRPGKALRGVALAFGAVAAFIVGVAAPGHAQIPTQWFFFDRAVWSADSRQVAVIGSYVNLSSHESFEDTVLVDLAHGTPTCISPSMNEITLSKDRRRLAGRGRWGIYDHELATATTRELIYQDPFDPGQIVTFAYTKEADALVAIRCDTSDPDISGVYRYPVDGSPAEKVFSDSECGPASLNYWQLQRREAAISMPTVPTGSRPVPIPGTNALAVQVDRQGRAGLVIRQDGRDTLLCESCRSEYVSWPAGGGRAFVATAPENFMDVVGPGALWLIRPGRPPLRVDERRHSMIVWSDSLVAYSVARPGRVMVLDAAAETSRPLRLSRVPEWVRRAPKRAADLWTIRVQETPFTDFETARSEALRLKSAMGASGFAIDRPEGTEGYLLSVGAWPDSVTAARQLGAVAKNRAADARGTPIVQHRAASSLQGQFDFGDVVSPDGAWRLVFRSHPHMFRPYLADEVWLEPTSGSGRRKLAVRAMATF